MKTPFSFLTTSFLLLLAACHPQNDPPVIPPTQDTTVVDTIPVVPPVVSPEDLYRPAVHYTRSSGWMNDPNGLFYKDGLWHLYYQCNPDGSDCDFGRMSWGHASSPDLMHWTEHQPVLYPDEMGAMFSGSSVVDVENKAGFGAGAVLAYYTASSDKQKICLAVSTDGGMSFQKYAGNPIIPSTGLANFRDPKVVWDAEHEQYVMVIAKGWDQGLEFWRSRDLMHWEFVPHIFHAEQRRCNLGQYECPDLFYLPQMVDGTSSNGKWILVLSTMPGGYIQGSGMMYFVGELTAEGYFVPDEGDYPYWVDFGADCYAGVTFNHAPDGRLVSMAWMSNWDYAPAVPPTPWKTACTLPREYSLREVDGRYVLCSSPVEELSSVAADWQDIPLSQNHPLPLLGEEHPITHPLPLLGKGCPQGGIGVDLLLRLSLSEDAKITLSNAKGERYEVRVDSRCRRIISDRSRAGVSAFAPQFAVPSMSAPIFGSADEVELRLIVDQSSVELFADGGATCVTNAVYPSSIYSTITLDGPVLSAKLRPLNP